MLYQQHELQRLALSPMRMFANNVCRFCTSRAIRFATHSSAVERPHARQVSA